MSIEEAIEKAAGELPPGASIYIAVENGAGFVEASNIDDETWDADTADLSLTEQVLAALDWCKSTNTAP
jgi:hypothetical protein